MALHLILAMFLLAMGSANAWGQGTILSLEGRTSYFLPAPFVDEDIDVSDGLGFGAAVTYGYRDRAVEFSIERVSVELEDDSLSGDLVMLPILMTGYWRFHPYSRRWFPFIGVGFGVIVNDFESDLDIPNPRELSDSVALHFSAGVEYFLWRNFSVSFQARYLRSRADVRTGGGEEEDSGLPPANRIKLDRVITGFGLKKYF